MPTYRVALSLKRPPDHGDEAMVELLQSAANQAGCVASAITAIGLIVECESTAVDVLETALRTKLGARVGLLERMIARPI